jgi:hypothetical protein
MKLEEERFKKSSERKLEKIKKDSNINQKSKEVFLKYLEFKQTERISYSRLTRILDLFYHILKNFKDVDFSNMTQEQANQIWIWINQQNWKEWTKYTYSRIFKNFVGWLNENYGLKESKLIEKVLSEEETKRLNDWADVLVEFFRRLEKDNPKLWKVLSDILKEKNKLDLLNE